MWTDPIVEEVRRARREHAAQYGFDVHRIAEAVRRQERLSGTEFVSLPPKPPRATPRLAAPAGLVREPDAEQPYETP